MPLHQKTETSWKDNCVTPLPYVSPADVAFRQGLFEIMHMSQADIAKHADGRFCKKKLNDVHYLRELLRSSTYEVIFAMDTIVLLRWTNMSLGLFAYLALYCTERLETRYRFQLFYDHLIKQFRSKDKKERVKLTLQEAVWLNHGWLKINTVLQPQPLRNGHGHRELLQSVRRKFCSYLGKKAKDMKK